MLTVTILGSNSAIPAFNRHPTAQVVQTAENSFLIDCGEGTQMQMDTYKIRRSKINHIFISHPLQNECVIKDGNRVVVECFRVQHRIECWGFLFSEKKNLRKIEPAKV